MGKRLLIVLAVLAASPAGLKAAPMCAWMTQGSAAGILDAEVTVAVNNLNDAEGSCTFTSQRAEADVLEISVHRSMRSVCPQGSATLKGIGNEAMLCPIEHPSSGYAEQVSGRVRDLYFNIVLRILAGKTTASAIQSRREALEQAAEQVAGNLD